MGTSLDSSKPFSANKNKNITCFVNTSKWCRNTYIRIIVTLYPDIASSVQ